MYGNSIELNIEKTAEAGDRYSCSCLGEMYVCGDGVHDNYELFNSKCIGAAKQRSKAMMILSLIWIHA